MRSKIYYIGFFRYTDSKTWQRTNVNDVKTDLEEYMNNLQYIDKNTIRIVEVELPI